MSAIEEVWVEPLGHGDDPASAIYRLEEKVNEVIRKVNLMFGGGDDA